MDGKWEQENNNEPKNYRNTQMESPIWGTISEWGWGDLVDAITGKCCLTNSLEGKVGSSLGLSPSSRPSAPELKVIMKEWAARGGGVQPWTGSHRLGKRHRHCRFIPTQRETSQVMPDKICTLWTNQICAAPKSSVGKGNGELAGIPLILSGRALSFHLTSPVVVS